MEKDLLYQANKVIDGEIYIYNLISPAKKDLLYQICTDNFFLHVRFKVFKVFGKLIYKAMFGTFCKRCMNIIYRNLAINKNLIILLKFNQRSNIGVYYVILIFYLTVSLKIEGC